MPGRTFKFPLATLIRQARRLQDALADSAVGPGVSQRLPAGFAASFGTLLGQVGGTPAAKAGQMGDTGTLTQEQDDAFHEMLRLMAAARRSAGLAFKGNKVVLHEEFQVGIHDPHGLGHEIGRARIILAGANKHATELGQHGWIAQDAIELSTALDLLGDVDLEQEASKAEGPGLTAASTSAANKLYANCLSLQNAARLQYPSTKPGHETARARFLLGEFPPHAPDAPPTPPAGPSPA